MSKPNLAPEAIARLESVCRERGWRIFQRCEIAHGIQVKIEKGDDIVTASFYHTGKALIQGKQTELLSEIQSWWSGGDVVQHGTSTAAAVASPTTGRISVDAQRIGIDESGKGDYFGPLVAAAVYVDSVTEPQLLDLGVMDSKRLSDKRISQIVLRVRELCPHSVVAIGPKRYNELYSSMRNVNSMLAWAHARCLENLLESIDCATAIADQFGNEAFLSKAVMEKGRRIQLIQRHRAEQDTAVAAASIVARWEFVKRLDELSTKAGLSLPKGSSDPKVAQTALAIGRRGGLAELGEYAKLHFVTTKKIGL